MASFIRTLKNSKPMIYAALFVMLLALLLLSPTEATLGNVVKIVYAHGAAQRIAAYAYLIAGGLGLVSLLLRGAILIGATKQFPTAVTFEQWAQAVAEVAIVFWIVQFVISAPAQILAWGAFTLNEPRVAGALWILLLTALIYIVARWIGEKNSLCVSIAAIANAAVYVIVLRGEVNILHPFDPILGSDSLAIKIFYAAIVVTMGFIAFQFTRDRVGQIRASDLPYVRSTNVNI
ncbi:MAG: hypothetical protein HZB51_23910 [Chloroflexi bacterium]|nr:hypothetical protein [Chloroflexota bacterium]